ncbi:MAG: DMT family transporter [Clostridiales bacterium]|nr:DMT family transporter [Clostridiales bacterium]
MRKVNNAKKLLAYVALVSVVLIWATSPLVSNLELVKKNYSPGMIIALRAFAATFALALINFKKLKELNKEYFKVAIPSGCVLAAASISQMVGYRYEATPGESAFLENISVIVIPILLFLFTRKKPTWTKVCAAILCFIGSAIIALEGGTGNFWSISLGKWLAALSGVLYGVNIAITGVYTKKLDSALYVFIQLAIQSVAAFLYSFIIEDGVLHTFSMSFSFLPLLTVSMLGVIATGICWTLRTYCFKEIPVMVVTVVMPFAAVLTGLLSVIIGMDDLTWNLVAGGLIVLSAIFLAELGDKPRKCKLLKEPIVNVAQEDALKSATVDETQLQ